MLIKRIKVVLLLFMVGCLLPVLVTSQSIGVGMGNTNPQASAQLDLSLIDQGIPLNQRTTTQRDTGKATYQLQYFVIRVAPGSYGYDIYADGKLYVHQPTIPSLPGNRGFTDTTQAGKCARLAISKIRNGEMPPTISPTELKKLGIPIQKP